MSDPALVPNELATSALHGSAFEDFSETVLEQKCCHCFTMSVSQKRES